MFAPGSLCLFPSARSRASSKRPRPLNDSDSEDELDLLKQTSHTDPLEFSARPFVRPLAPNHQGFLPSRGEHDDSHYISGSDEGMPRNQRSLKLLSASRERANKRVNRGGRQVYRQGEQSEGHIETLKRVVRSRRGERNEDEELVRNASLVRVPASPYVRRPLMAYGRLY